MKQSMIPWNIKQIKKMVENAGIDFNSPIQRKGGQWDEFAKSLLIHSILVDFVIPPVYFRRELLPNEVNTKGQPKSVYTVIDGKQRITTILSFVNGEFSLSWDTPSYINDDGEEIALAGCSFASLPMETQMVILTYGLKCYAIDEATDEEIEEMFFRLNNGVSLTKSQKTKAKFGIRISQIIDTVLEGEFFEKKCNFTKAAVRRADDLASLLQGMMLLYGYKYESFSQDECLRFATEYKTQITDEEIQLLKNCIDYLNSSFVEQDKMTKTYLKKINIPMLMLMAKKAMEKDIETTAFKAWFDDFFEKYAPGTEYANQCGAGSIKLSKVRGRIEIMERDFDIFFGFREEPVEESPVEEDVEEDVEKSAEVTETEVVASKEVSIEVAATKEVEKEDELDESFPFN